MMLAGLADWTDETVVLLGGGPSLTVEQVEWCFDKNCKVIAINRSRERAPWAHLLFAADLWWWQRFPQALAFDGLKVTTQQPIGPDVIRVPSSRSGPPLADGKIHIGWDSGYQALQLAILMGARRRLLLGYDAHGSNWHDGYGQSRRSVDYNRVLPLHRQLAMAAPGTTINCTPGSAIDAYVHARLEEVLPI